VDTFFFVEATEEAIRLSEACPDICSQSVDYLSLSSRICAQNRQWGFAQILSWRALEMDPTNEWANTLFAFTSGCDFILRLVPQSPVSQQDKLLREEFPKIIENFREGKPEYLVKFLMLVSGYMRLPGDLCPIVQTQLKNNYIFSRDTDIPKRIQDFSIENEWILQIDACEVGNEARYANHSDYPNGILVKRCIHRIEGHHDCQDMYPHIVALRDILPEDEITVNYGPSYWTTGRPGIDPLLLGEAISEPFTDCIYYNGVVTDFSCLPAPGGFLIPQNTDKRKRNSDILTVKRVSRTHPAYPGFGLFAKKAFKRGDIISLYAGIVDCNPFSGRHASKYTVDLRSDPGIGAFGFNFDPKTLKIRRNQRFMPFLTDFEDVSIPRRPGEEDLLSGIKDIASVGESLTRIICEGLTLPSLRVTMQDKLKQVGIPYENPNRSDVEKFVRQVRRDFSDLLSKPAHRIPHTQLFQEPELRIRLEC
jgi:hypothetical protein